MFSAWRVTSAVIGIVIVSAGLSVGAWEFYGFFFETPELSDAHGASSPWGAMVFALLAVAVGLKLLEGALRPASRVPTEPDRSLPEPDEQTRASVQAALERGRVIEAIKLYREATGVGLKDAKDAIDRLRRDAA